MINALDARADTVPMVRRYGWPVELSLELLGGKWSVVLLARLKQGPHRYGDLRKLIPGISDKMLTQRLRDLVASGLLVHDGERYLLTERDASASEVLEALYAWGQRVAPDVGAVFARGTPS